MVRLCTKNFKFKNDRKLAPHYIPIKRITRISNQAYKVRLPEKYYRIYNVVPVSFLKPWTASHDLERTLFLNLKNNQKIYELKSIETYMDTAKGCQYFVKWKGWPADYNI